MDANEVTAAADRRSANDETATATSVISENIDPASSQLTAPTLGVGCRREQGAFKSEEVVFLKTFLPRYIAFCDDLGQTGSGIRGLKNIKGDKGTWVLSNVYPMFKEKFDSAGPDGPNLESLQKKMTKWFSNHKASTSKPVTAVPTVLTKAPRATNAAALFARENSEKIATLMAEKRAQEGMTAKEANLRDHRQIKAELFDELDPETRLKYEKKAEAQNVMLKAPPPLEKVYEAQGDIVMHTITALQSLVGYGWGQHGDVVFYVIGAYRDQSERLQTFGCTVAPNSKAGNFVHHIPDYDNALRQPFKKWASEHALPVPVKDMPSASVLPHMPPELNLGQDIDGLPLLPLVDPEAMSETPRLPYQAWP